MLLSEKYSIQAFYSQVLWIEIDWELKLIGRGISHHILALNQSRTLIRRENLY